MSPAFVVPSIKHEDSKYLKLIITDSMFTNFVLFPTGVVPATLI